MRAIRISILLACGLTLWGCDKLTRGSEGEASNEGKDLAEKIEKHARSEAEDAIADHRGKDDGEDKGSASVMIGDKEWKASRARVSLRGKNLDISASSTQIEGKKVSRQEVKLVLPNYEGPGEYTLQMPSMFIGVGIDGADMEKAAGDDAKQTDVATKALGGSKTVIFMGGKATVTEANDDHVDGTFEWNPPPGMSDRPAFTQGKFHAVYRKKK